MPEVSAGGRVFDVDAVVFDKDDTLVDLDSTWGPVSRTWIAALAEGDAAIVELLDVRLGYDRAANRVVPDSILATHTLPEIGTHTAALLERHGLDAATIDVRITNAVTAIETDVYGLPVEPLTDLHALFGSLRDVGIAIGIFTSDSLEPTRHFIDSCGLDEYIGVVVTGEQLDQPKPHAEGLIVATAALGTAPGRVLMIGDSMHDHGSARAAGTFFLAVGTDTPAAAVADASVSNVGEIRVS